MWRLQYKGSYTATYGTVSDNLNKSIIVYYISY